MPRSKHHTYTEYPLLNGSTALQDLDAFCREWGGISRADGTRQIISAWSKARHGDLSALGAMGLSLPGLAEGARPVSTDERAPAQKQDTSRGDTRASPSRRLPLSKGNAHLVDLDL